MIAKIKIESWQELIELNSKLEGWIFRGQEKDWELVPSLLRTRTNEFLGLTSLVGPEKEMIRDFQRRIFLIEEYDNIGKSIIDILCLIQHYGGPTRLLDFTKSSYVATFFALEHLEEENGIIWAINYPRFDNKIRGIIQKENSEWGKAQFSEFILDQLQNRQIIIDVEPFFLNKRMSIQQGIFLMQGSLLDDFEELLFKTFEEEPLNFKEIEYTAVSEIKAHGRGVIDATLDYNILKIYLPRKLKYEILKQLWYMNINARTLFPGLSGYARSLYKYLNDADWSDFFER